MHSCNFEFFFSHIGYYNFWDEYLIVNTPESNKETFHVLVNRTGRKFNGIATEKQKKCLLEILSNSVYFRKPEEMFDDFPELERYNYLKEVYFTYYS